MGGSCLPLLLGVCEHHQLLSRQGWPLKDPLGDVQVCCHGSRLHPNRATVARLFIFSQVNLHVWTTFKKISGPKPGCACRCVFSPPLFLTLWSDLLLVESDVSGKSSETLPLWVAHFSGISWCHFRKVEGFSAGRLPLASAWPECKDTTLWEVQHFHLGSGFPLQTDRCKAQM